MWNPKCDTNEHIYEIKMDLYREQICGCQGGGGMDWKAGISNKCKLLYMGWINKLLLYGTGNYIYYTMIKYSGKEYEKNMYD